MTGKKALGFVVAASVVGLLSTGYQFTGHGEKSEGEVKCTGINSCKGTGQCGAADGSHADEAPWRWIRTGAAVVAPAPRH